MGLTPQEVAAGYEQASEKALAILPSLVVKEAVDLKDIDQVGHEMPNKTHSYR